MRVITVEDANGGQRLDKFLHRYLPEAPTGFSYKMLRKKNITLNGRKACGKETLTGGDRICFFVSEETLEKFCGNRQEGEKFSAQCRKAYERMDKFPILYEDSEVLLINKPAGILSQKAQDRDLSLNEWLIGYLIAKREVTEETLGLFHPSVCNRLDRNTSGIVICGKTLAGSQTMGALLKDRRLQKYYRLYVDGHMEQEGLMDGWMAKDEKRNKTLISHRETISGSKVLTEYRPLCYYERWHVTLVEARLVTGKSHQLRAQFADLGFPLVGDYKYGKRSSNDLWKKKFGIDSQMLHCYRLRFPFLEGKLQGLSKREIIAPVPEIFDRFSKME